MGNFLRPYGYLFFIALGIAGVLYAMNNHYVRVKEDKTVMDIPGFPEVFQLDKGETYHLIRNSEDGYMGKNITLVDYQTFKSPNFWFPDSTGQNHFYKGAVTLEIDGAQVTISHRPYQMPVEFKGLRLYIETIQSWNATAEVAKIKSVEKDVRLAACLANEPWGPDSLHFPLDDYRWKANSYFNTWSGLVPYNKRYYHRGEDYGLIPDKIEVLSILEGRVT